MNFKRIIDKNILIKTFIDFIITYPTPTNLNYFWNLGSLAGICLIIQIITGIFLAMHYVPNAEIAFNSIEHIMRDINNGWLLRYIHANGASFFFLVVYIHMFRGLFYASYLFPRHFLWCSGVIILLLMILTAFMGYVLPWGQMSFWAATVITKLASAIPIVGDYVVFWLWGGFAVDNATLNRFFSFHYLFPFLISGLVILHLIFLHEYGSNNPTGLFSISDKIPFDPYFVLKDFLGFCIFLEFLSFFVFFFPNLLGHTDNYIPANPLVTPTHIVPEWYFLPFFAILRSIPDKLLGFLSLINSIVILSSIPFLVNTERINRFFIHSYIYKMLFWIFFFNCLILGWIGGKPIETPYYEIGQFSTFLYFSFFFFFMYYDILFKQNPFFNLINFKIYYNYKDYLIKNSIDNNSLENNPNFFKNYYDVKNFDKKPEILIFNFIYILILIFRIKNNKKL